MGKFFTALKRGLQAASERSPRTEPPPAPRARLGWGTWIFLGLILILLLSWAGQTEDQLNELNSELRSLELEVEQLEAKVDSISVAFVELGS